MPENRKKNSPKTVMLPLTSSFKVWMKVRVFLNPEQVMDQSSMNCWDVTDISELTKFGIVPTAIRSLAGNVALVWMMPFVTVVTTVARGENTRICPWMYALASASVSKRWTE